MVANHNNVNDNVDRRDNTGSIDDVLKEMRSQSEFVKIPSEGYLDLVFYPNRKDGIQIIDGTFNGKLTGKKKSLLLTHEVGVEPNGHLQKLEISTNSGIPIVEMLRKGTNPLRVHKTGEGTKTRYWGEPIPS